MLLLVTLLVLVVLLFLFKNYNCYQTWRKKNVPCVSPLPIVGNFLETLLRKKSIWQILHEHYKKFPNNRYFGFYVFSQPILVIKDPELIKNIAVKDFKNFSEHAKYTPDNVDPIFSNGLLELKEEKWKTVRPALSPVFTTNKMKTVFDLMHKPAQQFTNYFMELGKNIVEVELKDVFSKYTNDIIATTSFGFELNTMKNPKNEFYKLGSKYANFTGIRFIISKVSPILQKVFNLKVCQDNVRIFFSEIFYNSLKVRRENKLVHKDLIHFMLEAQKIAENKNKETQNNEEIISDDDILCQTMTFFFGGFDTVSTCLSCTGYELVKNPDVQKQLIEEIDDIFEKYNGNINYEVVNEMKYLDMVIQESLRKWPPFPFYDKLCTQSYEIESNERSGKPLVIDKNTTLWLPAYSIQRDAKYYQNPEKFDPERFNEKRKQEINTYTFMPFGIGPRNCIGSRFALLENKILWVYLLRNFELIATKNTNFDAKWDPNNFSYCPENGFKVALKKRIF